MAQFLNLEGRDTFSATENIEKVKILNGGIPQNSDLNEQSAIDELRAKRIISDGFGDGKLSPVDFLLSSEGITKLKFTRDTSMPTDVYGRLYQDGNRFELRSALEEVVVALTTGNIYKKLPVPSSGEVYRGRVYIVHAKKDYLDPAKKLTVRDRTENSIQINTASREQRVYDFYVDWDNTGDTPKGTASVLPARIPASLTGAMATLDETDIFSGKISFATSELYGYAGQVYFVGNVELTTAALTVDITQSEIFKGKPRVTQYTGGDLWHRQDTGVSGLVLQKNRSEWPAEGAPVYHGLLISEYATATAELSHTVYKEGSSSAYVSTWTFNKLKALALDSVYDELLHIPAQNAYYAMASDLLLDVFDLGTEPGTSTTAESLIEAVLDLFPLETSEGESSNHTFILAVKGDPSIKTNYFIKDLGTTYNHEDVYNTNEYLVLCTFKIGLSYFDATGTHSGIIVFYDVEAAEETHHTLITDRRRYTINSPLAIEAPTEDVSRKFGTARFHTDTSTQLGIGDVVVIRANATEGNEIIGMGTVSYVDELGFNITVNMTFGVDRLGADDAVTLVDVTNASKTTRALSLVEFPDQTSPEIDLAISTGRNLHTQKGLQLTYPNGGNYGGDYVTRPVTLSTVLARIRGALASLIPYNSEDYDITSAWNKLHAIGMQIPFLRMLRPKNVANIDFAAPSVEVIYGTPSGHITMLYGTSSRTLKQQTVPLIYATRALNGAASTDQKQAMIVMYGGSTNNIDFAPIIDLNHTGNTTWANNFEGTASLLGGMISLRGKNSLIACEYGANIRTRNPLSAETTLNKAVIIDGQTGEAIVYKLRANYAEIANLTLSGNLTVPGTAAIGSTATVAGDTLIVGTAAAGSKGQVKLEAANSDVPTAVLSIKNNAGDSLEITATQLKDLTDGGETSLHRHPSGSVQYATPLGTIISSAIDCIDEPDEGETHTYRLASGSPYLYCNGQDVLIANYPSLNAAIGTKFIKAGDALPTTGYFRLPDLRGEFLRGVDDGQGHDPDAATRSVTAPNPADGVGSTQNSTYTAHTHTVPGTEAGVVAGGYEGAGRPRVDKDEPWINSGSSGGNETRPRNIYVRYYIKALAG